MIPHFANWWSTFCCPILIFWSLKRWSIVKSVEGDEKCILGKNRYPLMVFFSSLPRSLLYNLKHSRRKTSKPKIYKEDAHANKNLQTPTKFIVYSSFNFINKETFLLQGKTNYAIFLFIQRIMNKLIVQIQV